MDNNVGMKDFSGQKKSHEKNFGNITLNVTEVYDESGNLAAIHFQSMLKQFIECPVIELKDGELIKGFISS